MHQSLPTRLVELTLLHADGTRSRKRILINVDEPSGINGIDQFGYSKSFSWCQQNIVGNGHVIEKVVDIDKNSDDYKNFIYSVCFSAKMKIIEELSLQMSEKLTNFFQDYSQFDETVLSTNISTEVNSLINDINTNVMAKYKRAIELDNRRNRT